MRISCRLLLHILIWCQEWQCSLLSQGIFSRAIFYCLFGAIIVKAHLQYLYLHTVKFAYFTNIWIRVLLNTPSPFLQCSLWHQSQAITYSRPTMIGQFQSVHLVWIIFLPLIGLCPNCIQVDRQTGFFFINRLLWKNLGSFYHHQKDMFKASFIMESGNVYMWRNKS